MGVKGLWRLLLPIGRRISIETLEGKILAVDASIWLTQFLKAMRDPDTGKVRAAAHLIGFFRRLCRLRFHGIRPVFVFDGATPEIKRKEIQRRRQRREQFAALGDASVQRLAKRLLAENLKKYGKFSAAGGGDSGSFSIAAGVESNDRPGPGGGEDTDGRGGAFAEGFDPGAQREDDNDEKGRGNDNGKETAGDDGRISDESKPNPDDPSATNKSAKDKDSAEKFIMEEETYTTTNDESSDWDAVVKVDDFPERDDKCNGNDKANNKDDVNEEEEEDDDEFDIRYISSLPASRRKDAIEKAKREQRLRSRREFMPAAAKPDSFSAVQLTNFLRSSRLNRGIQDMAAKAAARDNRGFLPGELMASDRTVRVNLERSDDEDEDHDGNGSDDGSDYGQSKTRLSWLAEAKKRRKQKNKGDRRKKKVGTKKKMVRFKFSHQAASASSDEESWEDKKGKSNRQLDLFEDDDDDDDNSNNNSKHALDSKPRARQSPISKRILRVDDDDDVENNNTANKVSRKDGLEGTKSGPLHLSDHGHSPFDFIHHDSDESNDHEGAGFIPHRPSSQKKPAPQNLSQEVYDGSSPLRGDVITIVDDNDSDDNSIGDSASGGFMPHHRPSNAKNKPPSPQSTNGSTQPIQQDVIAVDDDNCEGEAGGGFLPQKEDPTRRRSSSNEWTTRGGGETSTGGFRNPARASASREHSLEAEDDHALALALQESEFDSNATTVATTAATNAEKLLYVAKTAVGCDNEDSCKRKMDGRNRDAAGVAQLVSEEKEKAACIASYKATDLRNVEPDSNDEDDVDWEEGEGSCGEEAGGFEEGLPTAAIRDSTAQEDETTATTTNDRFVGPEEEETENFLTNGRLAGHAADIERTEAFTNFERDNDSRENQSAAARSTTAADETTAGRGAVGELFSAETEAALERAQVTASNLANWAGRVFRRAIREVNEAKVELDCVASPGGAAPGASAEAAPVHSSREPKETSPPDDDNDDDDEVPVVERVKSREPKETSAPDDDNDDDDEVAVVERQKRSLGDEGNHKSQPFVYHLDQKSVSDETQARGGSAATAATRNGGGGSGGVPLSARPGAGLSEATLDGYQEEWAAERNQRERDMDTVTDEMREEAIRLLQLFGVPYVEAPGEAEAQCVALEALGLVDGVVTDDSDVFPFGGKTIYKNIFEEQKYAEVYVADDAEREMALGRNQMVALAMLLGGDYTEGVKGVGIVNAMEVLEAFDVSRDLKDGLRKFRKWLDGFDPYLGRQRGKRGENGSDTELSREEAFHSKHRTARTRWEAPEHFPADNVLQAYLNPVVDKSRDRFSWGQPDVDSLLRFCNRHMGWRPDDTSRLLEPVVERLASSGHYRQTRIESFMKYEDSIKFADVRSKRLRDVLGLDDGSKDSCRSPKEQQPSRKRRK